jgi:hypothetical protein
MVDKHNDSDDDNFDPNRYYEFTEEMRQQADAILSKEAATSF